MSLASNIDARPTLGHDLLMTTATAPGVIPDLTLGWRLRMALGHAGISVGRIAEEFQVTPHTISRWMNDKGAPPKSVYVKHWALMTGVDADWLLTGAFALGPDGNGWAPSGSNRRPTDYKADASALIIEFPGARRLAVGDDLAVAS